MISTKIKFKNKATGVEVNGKEVPFPPLKEGESLFIKNGHYFRMGPPDKNHHRTKDYKESKFIRKDVDGTFVFEEVQ